MSETTLLCDTSTGSPRPIVPDGWRKKVFDAVHGLSHPSIRTTRKLLNNKFVWHGMNKQVAEWARQCVPCQKAKIHRHVKAPLQDYPTTPKRFQHVNVDIVGPLPPFQGKRHLFTIVDRFTRWPEAVPMEDSTTMSCARAFMHSWVSRFGVPADVTAIEVHNLPPAFGGTSATFWE